MEHKSSDLKAGGRQTGERRCLEASTPVTKDFYEESGIKKERQVTGRHSVRCVDAAAAAGGGAGDEEDSSIC